MAEQNERLGVKFTADIKSFLDSINKMQSELGKTEQKFNEAGNNINGAFDKANVTINIFNQELQKAEKTADNSNDVFGRLGQTIAGMFAVSTVKNWTQAIFATRSEIQSMEVAFETLVGNKDKAADLFDSIREFAVSTPMEMPTLARGAQTLLSFGFSAEEIMPVLKQIGDVSMGDAEKFNSLILSFSQMSSAGKVLGQDLMQMIGAGFNPLAEIARTTGKSLAEVKQELEKGTITVKDVQNAYKTATSEGGKYNGMLEAQSKTLKGAYSNLQGAITDMQNDLGKQMEDSFATAIDVATTLVKSYEKIASVIKVVATAYGTYKAVILAIRAAEKINHVINLYQQYGKLAEAIKKTAVAQKMLNGVSKGNLAALGISAVAGAVMAWREYNNQLKEAEKHRAELDKENNDKNGAEAQQTINASFLEGYDRDLKEIGNTAGTTADKIEKVKEKIVELSSSQREFLNKNGGSSKNFTWVQGADIESDINTFIKSEESIRNAGTTLYNALIKAGIGEETAKEKAKGYVDNVIKLANGIKNLQANGTTIITSLTDDYATQEKNIKNMLAFISDSEKSLSQRTAMAKKLKEYDAQDTKTKWQENDDVKKALQKLNKEIEKEAEDAKKRRISAITAIQEFAKAEQKAIRDAALESQQLNTELRHDSLGKELSLIELEKEKTINAINDARDAKIEALKKNAYNEYIASQNGYTRLSYEEWLQGGGGKKVTLDTDQVKMYETQLSDATARADAKTKEALRKYKDIALDVTKEIEAQFSSELKRTQIEIEDRYKSIIESLIMSGTKDASLFAKAINARDKEILDVTYQKSIENINTFIEKRREEIELLKERGEITEQAYNVEIAELEKKQLDMMIESLEKLISNYMKLGVSADALKPLQNELDLLRIKAEKAGVAVDNVTKSSKKDNWKQVADGVRMVSNEFSNLENKTGDIASSFGNLFSELVEGFNKASEGGEKSSASMEDYTKAAQTAVSTAVSFYNAVKARKQANQDVIDAYKSAELEAQHQATLTRIAQYDYTKNNILAQDNAYEKATLSIKKYKQAQKEIQQYSMQLGNGRVQVGTATSRDGADIATKTLTGTAAGASIGTAIFPGLGTAIGAVVGAVAGALVSVFGSSKEVYAVYQDLQSKYGKIYDKDTYELNQAILDDYSKMDDATKDMIDNWDAIKEKMLEAREELENTITDFMGDVSNNLSDSLVEAFIGGNTLDAVDSFKDYVTSKIKELYMSNIMSAVFDKQFENLQKSMENSMDVGGDGSWIDDLQNFFDDIPNLIAVADDYMKQAEQVASKAGYDIFGTESSNQSSLSGTIAGMSEATASELNGNFLGLKLTAMEINTNVAEANNILNSSLSVQRQIASNTAFCERLVAIEEAVSHIDRVGVTVK